MSKFGPIIIAEDDPDDQEILRDIFKSLGLSNKLLFFVAGDDVLHYLRTMQEQPFLVISDVNLLRMSGLELRRQIIEDEALRKKSIPFIFLTTSAHPAYVAEAYDLMVQGYFQKEDNYGKVKDMISLVTSYWSICRHPNRTDSI